MPLREEFRLSIGRRRAGLGDEPTGKRRNRSKHVREDFCEAVFTPSMWKAIQCVKQGFAAGRMPRFLQFECIGDSAVGAGWSSTDWPALELGCDTRPGHGGPRAGGPPAGRALPYQRLAALQTEHGVSVHLHPV